MGQVAEEVRSGGSCRTEDTVGVSGSGAYSASSSSPALVVFDLRDVAIYEKATDIDWIQNSMNSLFPKCTTS